MRSAEMAAQIAVHVEAVVTGFDQAGYVAAQLVAYACEQREHRGVLFLVGLCGFALLLAVAETEVVGADVLVERGFGFEGDAAGVFAGPGLEVCVL